MIDSIILSHLITNEGYGRRVLPFLKHDYFQDRSDKLLFQLAKTYISTYNSFPTKEALIIEAGNLTGVAETDFQNVSTKIAALKADAETDVQWLVDQTEKF